MFKLDIVVPTHNRYQDIKSFLDRNAWFFLETGSSLFILDNASNSKIKNFLHSRVQKTPYLRVISSNNLCTATDNILKAFDLELENRLWIMGDRYLIPRNIQGLTDSIESDDFILLSSKKQRSLSSEYVKITKENFYKDYDAVISASCLSAIIYPLDYRPTVQDLNLASSSLFPHTYILAKNISKGCVVKYYKNIYMLNTQDGTVNWSYGDKWFEIGVEGWLDLVDRLRLTTNLKIDKGLYTCFVAKTSLGSFRGIFKRRYLGLINLRFFTEKYSIIIRMFPLKSIVIILIASATPRWVLMRILGKINGRKTI